MLRNEAEFMFFFVARRLLLVALHSMTKCERSTNLIGISECPIVNVCLRANGRISLSWPFFALEKCPTKCLMLNFERNGRPNLSKTWQKWLWEIWPGQMCHDRNGHAKFVLQLCLWMLNSHALASFGNHESSAPLSTPVSRARQISLILKTYSISRGTQNCCLANEYLFFFFCSHNSAIDSVSQQQQQLLLAVPILDFSPRLRIL